MSLIPYMNDLYKDYLFIRLINVSIIHLASCYKKANFIAAETMRLYRDDRGIIYPLSKWLEAFYLHWWIFIFLFSIICSIY